MSLRRQDQINVFRNWIWEKRGAITVLSWGILQ